MPNGKKSTFAVNRHHEAKKKSKQVSLLCQLEIQLEMRVRCLMMHLAVRTS